MNSRIGGMKDIDEMERPDDDVDNYLDYDIIKNNDLIENGLLVKRKNEDKGINDFGHRLVRLCKMSGMIILNGRTKGDNTIGKYTYVDKKGRSAND